MGFSHAKVGEFVLGAPIGRGGFSDVWAATHPQSRRRFVVKTLRGDVVRDAAGREAFEREADAVARLSHPNIVTLHDFGEVSAQTEAATEGRLAVSTPYLVTEFYPMGSIREGTRLLWDDLRDMLGDTLRALAHAHARGVLHLDIKPANVLKTLRLDGRTRYVVTDFGTAAFIDRIRQPGEAREHVQGTPMFMAPERLMGLECEQGPWTDIYAAAVMFWVLAAGRAPFPMRDVREIVNAHVRSGIPALPVDVLVPDSVHAWFARASHRDPAERFRSAAEALEALHGDEGAPENEFDAMSVTIDTHAVTAQHTGEVSLATTMFVPGHIAVPIAAPSRAPQGSLAPRRTIAPPELVEQPVRVDTSERELSLGAGLLGRRDPPLIGRHAECAALWTAFREANIEQRLRLVVVEGGAGTGKSRLARWLAESAAEYCGAIGVSAVHSEVRSRGDGLAPALARGLGARVSQPDELRRWAQRKLSGLGDANPYLADALADGLSRAVLPPSAVLPWSVRLTRQADRHQVIERVLRLVASTQPVVLWIDDAQWAPSALTFVESLQSAAAARPFALTIVMTARSEARETRATEFARIDALASGDYGNRVIVAPQSTHELAAVLSSTIALEQRTAEELARRSGGNPLLGLQWLETLFRSGELRKRKAGWGLITDTGLVAPNTMLHLWQDRVESALAEIPAASRDAARRSLELAATLGATVARDDWHSLCADIAPNVLDRTLTAIRSNHLGVLTPAGFTFIHGMLQEAILASAAAAGRKPELHRAVVRWLRSVPEPNLEVEESIAYHLERAGDASDAFDLMAEIIAYEDSTEAVPFRLRVGLLERTIEQIEPRERASRLLRLRFFRLRAEFHENTEDTSIHERIEPLRVDLQAAGEVDTLWDLDAFQADIIDGYANAEDCARRYVELLAQAESRGDARRTAYARSQLAVQYEILGRPEDAIEVAQAVRNAPVRGIKRGSSLQNALHSLVRSAFDLGRIEEGVATMRDCNRVVREGVSREALASAFMLRCEAYIRCGDYERAEAALNEALDISYTTVTNRDILCHVHKTALYARSGEWEKALVALVALDASMPPDRRARLRGLIVSAIGYATVSMANLGRADLWDTHVPAALDDLEKWKVHEPVLSRCLADAGVAWLRRGDLERARTALVAAQHGLTSPREVADRACVERIVASLAASDAPETPFLAEVSAALESCPPWLLEPLGVAARSGGSD